MSVSLPLGTGQIDISLPSCEFTVARPAGRKPVDVRAAAQSAIENPHGQRLSKLVDPSDSVSVVITDVTRATPEDILVDELLAALERGGVSRQQITVVIGLGLHRPMTDEEIESALGEHAELAVNHDPERTVPVGTIDDCEIEIFEPLTESDVICSTGMVEPHQYAGFSGGAKTAVIGAGGESQIRYTHGPEMLAHDGVRLGRIEDNPFRSFLDRAGDLLGIEFCLNVTYGPDGIMGASAGDPSAVVRELAGVARDALAVEIDRAYDAVLAGVGAPKDRNLYQTSRGGTYLVLGANNPLRPGGRVVIPAKLEEGAGEGRGEQRFYERLSAAATPEGLYEEMRTGYEPGAQRAFVLARTLREHDLWITNSQHPAVVEECLMTAANSIEDAVEPGSDVLVVPDALNTLLE